MRVLTAQQGKEDSMKRRRHTPEQIVRKLREADRLLAEGHQVPEVCKQLEISETTYHRWRAQYGGLKAEDVRRLKELETENARLKRIVADKELQIQALKKLGRETGEPGPPAPRGHPPAAGVWGLAAVGVPAGRAAPLHPASPAGRARPGPGPAGRAAPAQPHPSPLGLPARPRPAPRAGLEGEPQGGAAVVARGGPAGADQAPQAAAAWDLDHARSPAGGHLSRSRVGAGLPVRPDHRWEEVEAAVLHLVSPRREEETNADWQLDHQGELVERDHQSPIHRLLDGQLVVPSAKVLDERMPSEDHPGAAVLLEPTHRPQSRLETTMIGFDPVVGVPIGAMPRARQQFLQHHRIGRREVGRDLARRRLAVRRARWKNRCAEVASRRGEANTSM